MLIVASSLLIFRNLLYKSCTTSVVLGSMEGSRLGISTCLNTFSFSGTVKVLTFSYILRGLSNVEVIAWYTKCGYKLLMVVARYVDIYCTQMSKMFWLY